LNSLFIPSLDMEFRRQLNALWEEAQQDPSKMHELKGWCKDITRITREKKSASSKEPTAYNNFMKSEMAVIHAGSPGMGRKEVFRLAASRWRTAPENTKNRK
jgi:hypothetical protein